MDLKKTLLIIFLFIGSSNHILAADLPRDKSISYFFSKSFSEKSSCTGETLKEFEKRGVTKEECINRIKEVRNVCPEEAASKLPEIIPDEESNKLFQAVFRCYFRIMYNRDE